MSKPDNLKSGPALALLLATAVALTFYLWLFLHAESQPGVAVLLVGGALGDRWGMARTARGTLMARIALLVAFALVSIHCVTAVPAGPPCGGLYLNPPS